jgi:outer membrane receptor protein involved in Fe transport
MKMSAVLSAGVSAAALFLIPAAPALAQAAAPQDDAEEAEVDEGEIVVMAQGRAQALADVPVAISAVNADALAHTTFAS